MSYKRLQDWSVYILTIGYKVIKDVIMQPYFTSIHDFIAMGKHGAYVWSSWGIALVCIGGFILYSLMQRRRLIKQITHQQARLQSRRHTRS